MLKPYQGDMRSLIHNRADLPDTPFWEGDRVILRPSQSEYLVIGIDYAKLGMRTVRGGSWAIYHLAHNFSDPWRITVGEHDLILVVRGNLWRYHHAQTLYFGDIWEKAQFFDLLGQASTISNPNRIDGLWSRQEALEALCSGLGNYFLEYIDFWQDRPLFVELKKFFDPALGRRIREAILTACDETLSE